MTQDTILTSEMIHPVSRTPIWPGSQALSCSESGWSRLHTRPGQRDVKDDTRGGVHGKSFSGLTRWVKVDFASDVESQYHG